MTRCHRDPGVQRVQRVVADAHVVHRAGRVVLDDDVGLACEAVQQRGAFGLLGVDAEAALGATRRRERRRHLTTGDEPNEVGIRATSILITSAPYSTSMRPPSTPTPPWPKSSTQSGERRAGGGRRSGSGRQCLDRVRHQCLMLADGRRTESKSHALVVEGEESVDDLRGHARRDFGGAERAPRHEVLVAQHIGGLQHRSRDDASTLSLGRARFHRHRREELFEHRIQHVEVLHASGGRRPERIAQFFGRSHPLPDRLPLARRQDHEPYEPVFGAQMRIERGVAGAYRDRVRRRG